MAMFNNQWGRSRCANKMIGLNPHYGRRVNLGGSYTPADPPPWTSAAEYAPGLTYDHSATSGAGAEYIFGYDSATGTLQIQRDGGDWANLWGGDATLIDTSKTWYPTICSGGDSLYKLEQVPPPEIPDPPPSPPAAPPSAPGPQKRLWTWAAWHYCFNCGGMSGCKTTGEIPADDLPLTSAMSRNTVMGYTGDMGSSLMCDTATWHGAYSDNIEMAPGTGTYTYSVTVQ